MSNVIKFPNTENKKRNLELEDLFEYADCPKKLDKLLGNKDASVPAQDTSYKPQNR